MKIKVALEWFLNPDHFPFIIGVYKGWYKEAGLEVELIEPKEHYDGFEGLKKGEVDIVVNEPIHLFEHYFKGLKSLGCFFETRGGVMVKKEALPHLLNGEKIRVTTPAANEVTNRVGFEILERYARKQGSQKELQIEFIETDFYHIKNLKSGVFEAAWLCFDNFEGVESKIEGLDVELIDTQKSDYPNFSALEVMCSEETYSLKEEGIKKFIEITSKALKFVKENPAIAKEIYYSYTKESENHLMDEIILRTMDYLEERVVVDTKRWKELSLFLNKLEITTTSDEQYNSIWIQES